MRRPTSVNLRRAIRAWHPPRNRRKDERGFRRRRLVVSLIVTALVALCGCHLRCGGAADSSQTGLTEVRSSGEH